MNERDMTQNMESRENTAMDADFSPADRSGDAAPEIDRQKQLAELLNADDVICAHVYGNDGYSEFLFRKSAENIANFLGARPLVHQIVLTDQQERPFLWTIGYFIDRCTDKTLLEEVKKILIPIQIGDVEAKPIFSPSIGEVVSYQLRQQMAGDVGGAGL